MPDPNKYPKKPDRYEAQTAETGDPRYGKLGKGTKVASMISGAQKAQKTTVTNPKTGLVYRAGVIHPGRYGAKTEPHQPGTGQTMKKVNVQSTGGVVKGKKTVKRYPKRSKARSGVVPWLAKKETKRLGMSNPSKRTKGRKRTY